MEVVERMTVSNGQLKSTEGVDEVVKVWQEKDPQGLADWVTKHRGTPIGNRAASQAHPNGG